VNQKKSHSTRKSSQGNPANNRSDVANMEMQQIRQQYELGPAVQNKKVD